MKRCFQPAYASLVLSLCLAGFGSQAPGQEAQRYQPPRFSPPAGASQQPGGVIPALWNTPARQGRSARYSPLVDAHGNSAVVPAGYCEPYGCGPVAGGCCPPAGTCPPYGYGDDMMDLVGAGALGLDQCGPHYFDARMEAVFMSRDETFGRSINFTIDDQDPADIVLTSGNLDYDIAAGFRVIGRYDIGPLSVFEFGYFGIHDFGSTATAFDNTPPVNNEGDMFSLFSGVFDTTPPMFVPNNIVLPGGPNAQTERSRVQSISIESDLQTVEMSYRRYWVGFHPRVSGTLLAGARYTRLSEAFQFRAEGSQSLSYNVDAENDLVGFQSGADMWVCLRQGLRLGMEGKAGIYNNRFKVDNRINASVPTNLIDPNLRENFRGDNVAFIGEFSIDLVADILPNWSLRGGCEVLAMSDLALAGDNFNTGKIYDNQPSLPDRVPFVNSGSSALYTGFHVGTEYIW